MQLQNITFNDAQFNLLLNRYQDTKTIAISIQEIDEDYAELLTVNALPDEEEVIENEIKTELVAIPAEDSDVAHMLVEYGLIERGPELLDFFDGVYFYSPTQELLDYMKELDEKYNNLN